MNFAEVLTKAFLFGYEGRINRQRYWAYVLLLWLITPVLMIADSYFFDGSPIAVGIIGLLSIYPSTCVTIKRCHDRNMSGWWALVPFIPLIGMIWSLIVLGCLRGSVGDNRYGPDPLAAA